ncbi:HesA/MoeB/ThiF family protein [Neomegalonema sp.]|uniref:HesA/MoeB/ThiF family protein n=1 Tax=Neomegalonema sp. TaxID=2039713 RepID=UPI0026095846|nr:HesA/MoeB/ThiF family protein [Neomegalonema sp.]MDD2868359.1 HesA/MoeB/ThiF family protein [Neomegalonema sp.]
MTDRYARQIILPEVGAEGQRRLSRARILMVGAGGLGVPALQYLVGAGVGEVVLLDPDRVEEGNLHRQTIYGPHLGRPKAEAAAEFARSLNPGTRVSPRVERLTPANAPDLVAAADLVLDCADSHAASYTLSDACLKAGRALISASALGLSGYVGGFCGGAPSLRALFPEPTEAGATCATAGVLGPVVGMLGTLQAQMALSVLLGLKPSPLGQLIRFEMQGFRFSGFRFDGAPEPAGPQPRFISPGAISSGDFIVDLRDEAEAPRPVHPRAMRRRVEDFGPSGPAPSPDQRAVFTCRSGLRAWRAAELLRARWPGEIALIADP